MRFLSIIYLSSCVLLLASCGQKGPLYLPETSNTNQTQAK